jgi:hypothetical protein
VYVCVRERVCFWLFVVFVYSTVPYFKRRFFHAFCELSLSLQYLSGHFKENENVAASLQRMSNESEHQCKNAYIYIPTEKQTHTNRDADQMKILKWSFEYFCE